MKNEFIDSIFLYTPTEPTGPVSVRMLKARTGGGQFQIQVPSEFRITECPVSRPAGKTAIPRKFRKKK